MCNRYGFLAPVPGVIDKLSQPRLPLVFPAGAVPNLAPCEDIRPTDTAPIVRPCDPADPAGGVVLDQARRWLIPFFHKKAIKDWKPMCTNARAETLATTAAFREPFKRRRCLVPASH